MFTHKVSVFGFNRKTFIVPTGFKKLIRIILGIKYVLTRIFSMSTQLFLEELLYRYSPNYTGEVFATS